MLIFLRLNLKEKKSKEDNGVTQQFMFSLINELHMYFKIIYLI